MKKLYAADWAPNGTNGLIVVDEDSAVLDSLDEACFGINVMKNQVGDGLIVSDGETVWYARNADPEIVTVVSEITPREALAKAAVSPLDDGKRTEEFLRRHFQF